MGKTGCTGARRGSPLERKGSTQASPWKGCIPATTGSRKDWKVSSSGKTENKKGWTVNNWEKKGSIQPLP